MPRFPRLVSFLSLLLLAPLAGCPSDPKEEPDPDAGVEPPPPPETITVEVAAAGAALVAIHADDEWHVVDTDAEGNGSVEIPEGPYTVTSVCADGWATVTSVRATADDPSLNVGCYFGEEPPPVEVAAITVSSTEPVTVYVNGTSLWDVVNEVPVGIHDVVALTEDNRVIVRRGVEVDADATWTFDWTVEGTPLAAQELAFTLDAEESASISTYLTTAGGTYVSFYSLDGQTAPILPASLADEGDSHGHSVYATVPDRGRYASLSATAQPGPIEIVLPEAPETAPQFDAAPVGWRYDDGGDAWTDRYGYAFGQTGGFHFVFGTPAFFAENPDELGAPPVDEIPGWNADWSLPKDADIYWGFSLMRYDADLFASVDWYGDSQTAARAKARKLPAPAQRRIDALRKR